MRKLIGKSHRASEAIPLRSPRWRMRRIGIVSRDYNEMRDFSAQYRAILQTLDSAGCDTALFALFSIIRQKNFNPVPSPKLKALRYIVFEEFDETTDGAGQSSRRRAGIKVLYRCGDGWGQYRLQQHFGSISDTNRSRLSAFVSDEIPRRILGNGCLLVCGETNGVKYCKDSKRVKDQFGLRRAIPRTVEVVLNPVHDRMTRFEMTLKRRFLSSGQRWVISVWNKGKRDRKGRTRDGVKPGWSIFRNGKSMEKVVTLVEGPSGFDIGVIDL